MALRAVQMSVFRLASIPVSMSICLGSSKKMRDRRLLDLLDAQDDARVRGFDIASVLPEPSVQIAEQVEEHERRIRPVQRLNPVEKIVPRLFVHQLVEMLPQVAPDPLSFLKSHLTPSLT